MKLDKKQLPTLILLGVLVIACIGYVSFTLTRTKRTAPAPAPATEQSSTSAKEASDDAANTTLVTVLPARRDPFMAQELPGQVTENAEGDTPSPVTRPRSVPSVGINSIDRSTGKIPPLNPFTCAPLPGASMQMSQSLPGQAATTMVAPEPIPEFVLTGVIRGAQNVAIIRVGEKGRYVVKQGQLIDGRYRVLSVTDDGAVLAYKNRRISVKLGGA